MWAAPWLAPIRSGSATAAVRPATSRVVESGWAPGYYVVQFVERFRNEDDFGTANIPPHPGEGRGGRGGGRSPPRRPCRPPRIRPRRSWISSRRAIRAPDSFAELAKANS